MLKNYKFVIRDLIAPASLPALGVRRRGAAVLRPISAQSQPFAIPNPPEAGEVRYGFAGCPTRRFCVWVLGLPFLALSSRPEQRRLLPLRSGGIMARPNPSPRPVIPNGVREVRNLSCFCLANRNP